MPSILLRISYILSTVIPHDIKWRNTKREPRQTPHLLRTMDAALFTILIGSFAKVARLRFSETGDGSDKIEIILICAGYGDGSDALLSDIYSKAQSRQFYKQVSWDRFAGYRGLPNSIRSTEDKHSVQVLCAESYRYGMSPVTSHGILLVLHALQQKQITQSDVG